MKNHSPDCKCKACQAKRASSKNPVKNAPVKTGYNNRIMKAASTYRHQSK